MGDGKSAAEPVSSSSSPLRGLPQELSAECGRRALEKLLPIRGILCYWRRHGEVRRSVRKSPKAQGLSRPVKVLVFLSGALYHCVFFSSASFKTLLVVK